ncbi:MAG: ATP-dependent RNA helicase HrpA [Micromonosporaceae bacterium]|nr:ATP-dependent RNA helicase HrpA [Micromonosporaceae bacterium]
MSTRPESSDGAARPRVAPPISYPAELPVSQKKDEIAAAIRDHQVVIVAGETGSGKTTQLPKICLELGRGTHGVIGHTQPRRLAARTVAERIAEELNTELGGAIGYQVRFTDRVSRQSMVKVMTDGILLSEIQRDRNLRRYDTLIIDEAHERSLNIDFILGRLKQLLPHRPDLKLIITSATIDPERFSAHFRGAPIVEVSGRTYPVEVRYRPIVEDAEDTGRDQIQAICDGVEELRREPAGDILVFASGEREIRDAADALGKLNLPHTEILPLYARLAAAEQHKVFRPHASRRIVIATNVAETSLTVPGIKYVVDPGTARISRYSNRTKVQRLPIEPISQASANQRKGRCGRLSDGICIRLYSEDDFNGRPEFTDPEILRTSLASVILQMTAAKLGDIETFPFIDGPDRRNIADGVRTLEELGALEPKAADGRPRLTALGRRLAQLPVDPRLARMVLEAGENACLREVLVIVSALSIQDPRERPAEHQQAADEKHGRFADKDSDFLAYLNLWNYLQERQKALSSNQFRKLCKAEFLHYLRIREWQDVHGQLRQVAKGLGLTLNEQPADSTRIHTSVLAGLLSHIGLKDTAKREYAGARNAKFAIFPGSALFKKQPQWVVSAELVETSRLWGRINARIEPGWVEPLAQHVAKRSYSEPHWEKKQGAVMAYEKVTLYGVPIVAQRRVHFGRIDQALSRELFIRHALVEGDWETRHEFFHANRAVLEQAEDLEHRARRRDIVVDDGALFEFYDQRIPADVVSGRHFDSWWKQTRRREPGVLTFALSMLVGEAAAGVTAADYPDCWELDGLRLRLTYQFEPGSDADGVTAHIPLPLLSRTPEEPFGWQVPGLREELITALIRSLPKSLRRNFVPVPDHAKDVLDGLPDRPEGSLLPMLERELEALTGVAVPRDAWRLDQAPEHLRMTFRVVDEQGDTLAEGKDLAALRQKLAPKVAETISAASSGIERRGLREWSFGALPATAEQVRGGLRLTVYPALVDEGDSVGIRVFDTRAEQQHAMWRGTRRLLLLNLPSPTTYTQGRLTNPQKLALSRNPHRGIPDLLEDCAACALDELVAEAGGPAWDQAGFDRLREAVRPSLVETVMDVVTTVEEILSAAHAVSARLTGPSPAVADVRAQLDGLIYRGFAADTGWERLPDLVRYLNAAHTRLDRLPGNEARDRQHMLTVRETQEARRELVEELGEDRDDVREIRWMIEELRVSLHAQHLGTAYPISAKRIYRAIDALLP